MAYVIEAGVDLLALRLKWWLDKAFGLARGLTELAASTLARRRRELDQDLDAILRAPATCDLAQALQVRMRRARDQLLTFVTFPGKLEVTNNACERDLRPAVAQRKVTNGSRAMWAAKGETDVRTVVATAALRTKATPFSTLLTTIIARSAPASSNRTSRQKRERKKCPVGNYLKISNNLSLIAIRDYL